jgi:hypothetical protein
LGGDWRRYPLHITGQIQEVQVRVWGDWTDASYYETVDAPQNRDGTLVRLGVTFAIDLGHAWTAGPYGTYNRANTKGDDYDAHGWESGLQMTSPEFAGFKIIALVSYGQENYDNLNSLTGFTKKRLDRPLGTSLTITVSLR